LQHVEQHSQQRKIKIMSSLLEKIAAKRAAELALKGMVEASPQPIVKVEESAQAPKVEEKILSFAEKMALKKITTATPEESSKPSATNIESKKEIPAEVVAKIMVVVAEEEEQEADLSSATPEDAQAYADIKAKIDMLASLSDMDLKGAMTDLKKSLLQNPQACYLILPQDIGQMVIALRAMKNETVVAAEKVPKEKKAKASKALTAEEIAAAFDEL